MLQAQEEYYKEELDEKYEVKKSIPFAEAGSQTKFLSDCVNVSIPQEVSLQEILQYSAKFPLQFPVRDVLCKELLKSQPDVTENMLEHHINSAYPLIHEAALSLYINFLEYKKKFGTKREKTLYADMNVMELVQRLLQKRAAVFCGNFDSYKLMSGEEGNGGWETVGMDREQPPLVLEDCLSYDEIKLSAFLALTCHSVFINDGKRRNCGVPSSNPEELQRHGVVVGMVGPRLSHGEVMDWHEVNITDIQNVKEKGYGSNSRKMPIHHWRQLWANFYGVPSLPSFKEALKLRQRETERVRFVKLRKDFIFDNEIYTKRICIAAELLLMEAESRAKAANKTAYVHVVGIGLGVWRLSGHQEQLFLDSFAICLRNLHPLLSHVSDVNFSWFSKTSCGGVENGGTIGNNRHAIRIHFSNRPPHSRLEGNDDSNKLLVASYAWDGNSLPGNEFWDHSLQTSGDPANACSTQVSELQNPHVNCKKISGSNLHIASAEWGVLHVADYARRKLNKE